MFWIGMIGLVCWGLDWCDWMIDDWIGLGWLVCWETWSTTLPDGVLGNWEKTDPKSE